jgi:hypothetical protein
LRGREEGGVAPEDGRVPEGEDSVGVAPGGEAAEGVPPGGVRPIGVPAGGVAPVGMRSTGTSKRRPRGDTKVTVAPLATPGLSDASSLGPETIVARVEASCSGGEV